jgi:hypothetical protein
MLALADDEIDRKNYSEETTLMLEIRQFAFSIPTCQPRKNAAVDRRIECGLI